MGAPAYDLWQIEDFDNAYRNWIMTTMHMERHGILMDLMADTPFEWSRKLPRDSDRATDGRYLRYRFSSESGEPVPDSWIGEKWPCSFLEFLVALSYAIVDRISYEPGNPDQATELFWELLGNANLDVYDDERMLRENMLAYYYASETMGKIMGRRYDYNGNGGLFPLRKPEMDQREVEIWYQANAYMIEKEGL